ncbi:hypothetical protein GCM10027046_13530 [Uliginosibacterium flavum]|uniref:Uncharacterized protein n=1 Tax=Uliginosibacterium flavum TaxID=1396831 RepID=A0ABV2TQ13_9RHOO
MSPSTSDDPIIDKALLTKADALIRRNRPDGVGSDADELPLLTDALDEDLPELTDAFDTLEPLEALDTSSLAPMRSHVPERVKDTFALSLDLDIDDDLTPSGQFQQLSPLPPRQVIENAVDEAVARTRAEMRAEHERAIREAAARARAEAIAELGAQPRGRSTEEQEIAIRDACAKARADALHEARAQQLRAVQAAQAQGREEAEINQWPAMQEARREAVQNAAMAMGERLIELDAQIAQGINQWLAKELPPIIAGELLGLSERLRMQTAAHLRVTLLPELSEQISKVLDSALRGDDDQNQS